MDVNFNNSSGLSAAIYNKSIKQEGEAVLQLVTDAVENGKEAQAQSQSGSAKAPGVGENVDKYV